MQGLHQGVHRRCDRRLSSVMNTMGNVAAGLGMAGDVVEACAALAEGNAAMAGAKALNAVMSAAQMAADAAATAVEATMGTDPAGPSQPQGIGAVLVPGAPTVLIGGFPMIQIPNPAEGRAEFPETFWRQGWWSRQCTAGC